MAAESSSRFSHLLQPIRDLSKVWKIEIAEELERYLEEVGQLLVTDPVDGISQLNFAEAALLIQGSTAIYSRKVELLYQLVYQALDLLGPADKKDPGKKGKTAPNGLWAALPDTDELLTIDHLIREGRNILLDASAPEHHQAPQRRLPLFLMPRDAAERSRNEFRISSCTVHHTGAYLLQESDARLLVDAGAEEGAGGALPAPPREVQDLDDRLQELLREIRPQESSPDELALAELPLPLSPAPRGMDEAMLSGSTPTKLRTPLPPRGLALAFVDAAKRGASIGRDPWASLDEHDVVGHELPLVVGKTSKRINGKKLLVGAKAPVFVEDFAGIADEDLWDASLGDKAVRQLLASGHPVESLFLAAAGCAKSGGPFEAQRAGFSAAWLEFEDLFCRAAARRRSLKGFPRRSGAPGTPNGSDDEAGEAVVCAGGAAPLPDMSLTPLAFTPSKGSMDLGMTPLPDFAGDSLCVPDERREEVARLENMIEDAQSRYEATIRQHLHSTNKDAADGSDERFTELYAKVRRWQDQLLPVLKEFETRPEFDMDEYSDRFLDKMINVPKSRNAEGQEDGEQRTMKFARLVHGQPRWEICRRFMTCLVLTNNGNTDIVAASDEDRINDFSIKLLDAKKRVVSIEGGQGLAATRRKSKAVAPVQDAPPVRKRLRRD